MGKKYKHFRPMVIFITSAVIFVAVFLSLRDDEVVCFKTLPDSTRTGTSYMWSMLAETVYAQDAFDSTEAIASAVQTVESQLRSLPQFARMSESYDIYVNISSDYWRRSAEAAPLIDFIPIIILLDKSNSPTHPQSAWAVGMRGRQCFLAHNGEGLFADIRSSPALQQILKD